MPAITLKASGTLNDATPTTSDSNAVDIGTAGTDTLLVVAICAVGTSSPVNPSMTYDGTSMVGEVTDTQAGAGDDIRSRMFFQVNPTSGSNNLVVNHSTAPDGWALVWAVFENVTQTSPTD